MERWKFGRHNTTKVSLISRLTAASLVKDAVKHFALGAQGIGFEHPNNHRNVIKSFLVDKFSVV